MRVVLFYIQITLIIVDLWLYCLIQRPWRVCRYYLRHKPAIVHTEIVIIPVRPKFREKISRASGLRNNTLHYFASLIIELYSVYIPIWSINIQNIFLREIWRSRIRIKTKKKKKRYQHTFKLFLKLVPSYINLFKRVYN